MDISYDEAKRLSTLKERGLDFAGAPKVFAAKFFERVDDRKDYGEDRFNTAAILNGRGVIVTWTPRGGTYRIISMRHMHDDEEKALRRAGHG